MSRFVPTRRISWPRTASASAGGWPAPVKTRAVVDDEIDGAGPVVALRADDQAGGHRDDDDERDDDGGETGFHSTSRNDRRRRARADWAGL